MSDLLEKVRALAAGLFAEAHRWEGERAEGGGQRAEVRSNDRGSSAEIGALRQQRPTVDGYRWGERVRREKIKFVPPLARKGELRMTEFKRREAVRCGVSASVIYERLMAGKYPGIKIRRPHCKFVFVKPPPILPGDFNVPLNCELPLKVYVAMEAARLRTTERAIYVRIYRGKYPGLEFRRVNQRVVFVKAKEMEVGSSELGNLTTDKTG